MNNINPNSNSSTQQSQQKNSYEKQCKQWISTEFSSADFGDQRLTNRFLSLLQLFSASPSASIPQAANYLKEVKGIYRFFNNEKVTQDNILKPHQQATATRISEHKTVLCIQDTSTLNYTHLKETKGLGTISTEPELRGMLLHTTMAITPDRVPLGIIHQQTLIRPPEEYGKKHDRKNKDIEEKESQKWINSLLAMAQLQKKIPDCVLINIGDREADIYEMFESAILYNCQILIRAAQDRRVDHPEKYLWAFLENQPISTTLEVLVPRKNNKKERTATVELRFTAVTLNPPANKPDSKPISLYAIYLNEPNPPKMDEPLSWLLLTTLPVLSLEDALLYTDFYAARFSIEIFHKILKSGCNIEEHQFKSAEALKRCLAVDSIVAWRIMFLTMLGRSLPDIPCTVILEDYEYKALFCFINKTKQPPITPLSLQEAVLLIAKLGGFLNRKRDGHPGVQVIWCGLKRLSDISSAWLSFGPIQNKVNTQ
ncbi:MAG: IS4 family transposase [Nanoarchaeota archaeon]|nr:IS4 family transposase [Nanoarchaeota archaeon]